MPRKLVLATTTAGLLALTAVAPTATAKSVTWHVLTIPALKKTVNAPSYAPLSLHRSTDWFHERAYNCELHIPAGLTAMGTALKTTESDYQEVLVQVEQVSSHAVAVAAVASQGRSTCKGETRVHLVGLPKGAVAWSDAPAQYKLDINAEVAIGNAIISAQVGPRNAFGAKSDHILIHALAVTVTMYQRAALH